MFLFEKLDSNSLKIFYIFTLENGNMKWGHIIFSTPCRHKMFESILFVDHFLVKLFSLHERIQDLDLGPLKSFSRI